MLTLRIAAAVEAVTLAILLANLLTVHAQPVTTYAGPLHGMSYLVVIATAAMTPRAQGTPGARWSAFVPGVGGLLALRRLRAGRDGRDG
ncbi:MULTISPECIES: DUF3817 domain-containing protein [unclassified Nonomuraea]|uniref:DUF3817 domain-containing protein n=1 Tax=unclassified Nonomuraea TaxID=2593643 RepID=UPI0034451FFC